MLVVATISVLAAKQPYFIGTCDKDALGYKVGEKMKFSINLVDKDGKIIEGQKLQWRVSKDNGSAETGEAISSKAPLDITTVMEKAGFARVTVTPVDENGKRMKDMDLYDGGACAGFNDIKQITPEPKDFDAFWAKQLSALAKVPMKCDKKDVSDQEYAKKGYKTYILTLDCLGKPAKAWLTMPENAKPNSLPIRMLVHGYGVSRINPSYAPNTITLSVARHSYELGQPKEYYDAQKNILKGFGIVAQPNVDPEKNYFKFMILRDIRALQYTKTLPEWNKKQISVHGGSMGGFQSVFVAFLDKDITSCHPAVPWMCNLNGEAEGKQKALFAPYYKHLPSALYFDSTNAVKRVKCPVHITARLGDYVCPPSGVTILYHNAPKATLEFAQNGTHPYRSPWKNNPVYKKSK